MRLSVPFCFRGFSSVSQKFLALVPSFRSSLELREVGEVLRKEMDSLSMDELKETISVCSRHRITKEIVGTTFFDSWMRAAKSRVGELSTEEMVTILYWIAYTKVKNGHFTNAWQYEMLRRIDDLDAYTLTKMLYPMGRMGIDKVIPKFCDAWCKRALQILDTFNKSQLVDCMQWGRLKGHNFEEQDEFINAWSTRMRKQLKFLSDRELSQLLISLKTLRFDERRLGEDFFITLTRDIRLLGKEKTVLCIMQVLGGLRVKGEIIPEDFCIKWVSQVLKYMDKLTGRHLVAILFGVGKIPVVVRSLSDGFALAWAECVADKTSSLTWEGVGKMFCGMMYLSYGSDRVGRELHYNLGERAKELAFKFEPYWLNVVLDSIVKLNTQDCYSVEFYDEWRQACLSKFDIFREPHNIEVVHSALRIPYFTEANFFAPWFENIRKQNQISLFRRDTIIFMLSCMKELRKMSFFLGFAGYFSTSVMRRLPEFDYEELTSLIIALADSEMGTNVLGNVFFDIWFRVMSPHISKLDTVDFAVTIASLEKLGLNPDRLVLKKRTITNEKD